MKIDIVKTASRNIFFSVFKKLYVIIISFVMRTIMIYTLGIEYTGLNGIYTSLLNILNLAELGVGTAIVYTMYKPIAKDDQEKVCNLLHEYRRCYRVIGFVILGLGLLCMPLLDFVIEGDVPEDLNIYILFFLHLISTVCSYWMFSYKSSLFSAFGRSDIESRINMIVSTLSCLGQAVVLFFLKNYYVYMMIGIGSTILNNVLVQIVTRKMYPELEPRGGLIKEERKKLYRSVEDIFMAKVGGAVVNSVDTLVISAVLGITVLGYYQNYYMVIKSVSGVVTTVYRSCIAGIGNKFAIDGTDKGYESFENMSFWMIWICCFCCSVFGGLLQPFISMWVGDQMLLEYGIVILLCVFFYVFQMMGVCGAYEEAGGIWHYDRFRPLLEAAINLTLNLIMVQYIGLYGILLSTIISMACFSLPWLYINLFKHLFKRSMRSYILMIIKNLLGASAVNVIIWILFRHTVYSLGDFMFRLVICMLIPTGLLLVLYGKTERFQWLKRILLRMK